MPKRCGNIKSISDLLKRLCHVLGYYVDDEATVEEAGMQVLHVLSCTDESVLRAVIADYLDIPRPGWTYPASVYGERLGIMDNWDEDDRDNPVRRN